MRRTARESGAEKQGKGYAQGFTWAVSRQGLMAAILLARNEFESDIYIHTYIPFSMT